MTSKNSFLISMRENMRRRMWYPLLLLLIQIFEYPVAVTMVKSMTCGCRQGKSMVPRSSLA